MIASTTTAIDGRPVTDYVGVMTGEAVLGANVFRDLFAGLRDIVGGRSAGYERSLRQASPTVTLVRNDPVNTASRTLIEASMGCKDDQATLQGG